MLDAASFRDLLDSRRRDWRARLARSLFGVVAKVYSSVVRVRNGLYDARFIRVQRADSPVISVGNLTLGGTGKTPLVAWLVQWAAARGMRVAIISRGYGARGDSPNDEALELAARAPGTPHVQNPRRILAARRAVDDHRAELIVADDAFQHRRLYRDLDIVLLDGTEPFGMGHVFPRGLLREPLCGLRRAHAVVLTRSDAIDDSQRETIRQQVATLAPGAVWLEAIQRPSGLRAADGSTVDLARIAGQRVAAFCGLGNPYGFLHTLRACGCEVAGFRAFPDHHAYSDQDLDSLAQWTEAMGDVAAVVCTHKDLVKIPRTRLGALSLWAVTIDWEFVVGQGQFEALLNSILTSRVPDVPRRVDAKTKS